MSKKCWMGSPNLDKIFEVYMLDVTPVTHKQFMLRRHGAKWSETLAHGSLAQTKCLHMPQGDS